MGAASGFASGTFAEDSRAARSRAGTSGSVAGDVDMAGGAVVCDDEAVCIGSAGSADRPTLPVSPSSAAASLGIWFLASGRTGPVAVGADDAAGDAAICRRPRPAAAGVASWLVARSRVGGVRSMSGAGAAVDAPGRAGMAGMAAVLASSVESPGGVDGFLPMASRSGVGGTDSSDHGSVFLPPDADRASLPSRDPALAGSARSAS